MFAIAFDLVVAEAEPNDPRHFSQAYAEIGSVLRRFGFRSIQGRVYVADGEDLANLTSAMVALTSLSWFPDYFTTFMNESAP